MKGIKLFLVLLLSLAVPAFCTGCWSGRELDELAVVMGVGLDASGETGEIAVTAQTAKAADMGKAGEGASGPAYWNVTETGPDPFTALRGMADTAGRRLYLSHNQVLIFGRDLAESGIQSELDYFLRDRESRANIWVIVADGQASELLDFEPKLEKLPARQLAGEVKAKHSTGEWPAVDLLEFANHLMERSRAPLAPLVAMVGEGEERTAQIVGTAVFRDDKMVGTLSETETRGMLWLQGKIQGAALEGPIDGGVAGVEVVSATGKMIPVFTEDGGITLRAEIEAKGHMSAQAGRENLSSPEEIDRLEASLCETIRAEVEAAFLKARELGTDIYGFGNLIHEKEPGRWESLEENWHETFRSVRLEVEVVAQVSNTGRLTQPAFPKE